MGRYEGIKNDIVIDIETVTIPPTEEEVTEAMAEYEPPANYKDPAKIEAHKAEFVANLPAKLDADRRFSFEGKRMISCALGMANTGTGKVENIMSWASDDPKVIAKGIVDYLNQFKEYRIIGWNHTRFDLPEVVKTFFLTGLRPKYKPAKWDVIDLCNHLFRGLKMKNVAKGLGLELHEMDGSDVARLYANGEWDQIKEYNEYDVYLTGMIFLAADKLFTF